MLAFQFSSDFRQHLLACFGRVWPRANTLPALEVFISSHPASRRPSQRPPALYRQELQFLNPAQSPLATFVVGLCFPYPRVVMHRDGHVVLTYQEVAPPCCYLFAARYRLTGSSRDGEGYAREGDPYREELDIELTDLGRETVFLEVLRRFRAQVQASPLYAHLTDPAQAA